MKVNYFRYPLLLFWKRFLCQGVKQIILKFLRDFCLIFWHQDHFQNNNKYGGKSSHPHKNKKHLFSYKTLTLTNSSKTWKKINFLSNIHNLTHIHQLSLTYFGNLLLLDPSTNENSNVSFAQHKATKNTTTFWHSRKTLTYSEKKFLKLID